MLLSILSTALEYLAQGIEKPALKKNIGVTDLWLVEMIIIQYTERWQSFQRDFISLN